jgi:hypothetical protein
MSQLVLTKNNLVDVPLPGRANVYVKADDTLALRDSEGNEFIFLDTKKDMSAVPRRLMTGRTSDLDDGRVGNSSSGRVHRRERLPRSSWGYCQTPVPSAAIHE